MQKLLLVFFLFLLPHLAVATDVANGQVGDDRINLTTIDLGDFKFTNGNIGDDRASLTTMDLGGISITTGNIGDQPVHITTIDLDSEDYDYGEYGTREASDGSD